MTTVCGIDFGTSNSTIAIVRDGETRLVPVEGDSTTIPSAIFFPSEGEPPLYGRAAISAYTARDPGRLMRSLKSILGSDLMTEKTAVGGRFQTFESILVGFVGHLKRRAETFAGSEITEVVMGRPVHFVDGNDAVDQRAEKKLGDIARAAGFKSVAFQYEPIAAALAFEDTLTSDERVFIADIGGGTADFSIVEVGPSRRNAKDRARDILANDGVRVGGTNLDMRLSMKAVMPQLGARAKTRSGQDLPRWPFVDLATWHAIHTLETSKKLALLKDIFDDCADQPVFQRLLQVVRRQQGHRLAGLVEQAKIDLSARTSVVMDLKEPVPGLVVRMSKSLFEGAIAGELERLAAVVARTLDEAGTKGEGVSALFLTGGTTAVPAVKQLMTTLLPSAKVVEGDLFNSVGFGLALEAKRRFLAKPIGAR